MTKRRNDNNAKRQIGEIEKRLSAKNNKTTKCRIRKNGKKAKGQKTTK